MGNFQDSASNEFGRGRTNKLDKTRRSWSLREDEVLLAALKELVVQGWKSDNGFRAGYLRKLEEAIKNACPGTDLKGIPHIHSRISTWKRNYNSLTAMLGYSGVGFNVDGKYMVDCDNEQWENIVKRDPNARLMRTKSWPYLDDWKEIFGKDRATGIAAEDVVQAVNDMHAFHDFDNDGGQGDYHPQFETEGENDAGDDSVCQPPTKDAGAARVSGRKRKADEAFDGLCELMGEMSRNSNERMDIIASRLGYEQDLGKARKEVYDHLNNMPTLTISDKFDAYEILAGDKQALELFMGLPDEAKPQYVLRILMSKNCSLFTRN